MPVLVAVAVKLDALEARAIIASWYCADNVEVVLADGACSSSARLRNGRADAGDGGCPRACPSLSSGHVEVEVES